MNKNIIILCICSLFFSSCTSLGYILIEKSEGFKGSKLTNQKIIYIDPEVKIYKKEVIDYPESQKLEASLFEALQFSKQKHKLNFEYVNLLISPTESYYNDLIALKNDFIHANNLQNSPLNFSSRPKLNTISKSIFIYPPLISYENGGLTQKYDTPYFGFVGVYSIKSGIFLYHIIVNVETAETVYREWRKIPIHNLHSMDLKHSVFDSFSILKTELNEK